MSAIVTINVRSRSLFPFGQIVATPGALGACTRDQLTGFLLAHGRGNWGIVSFDDWKQNDAAIDNGSRIFSAYPIDATKPCKGYGENCLWIITEADRSATTFLLPDEY